MGISLGDILNLGAVFLNNGHNSPGKSNTLSIIGTALNIFSGYFGNAGQTGNSGWPSVFGGQRNYNYGNQSAQQVLAIQNSLNQAFVAGKQQIQNDYNIILMQMNSKLLDEKGKIIKEFQDNKINQAQYDAKIKSLEDDFKLAKQQAEMKAQQLMLNLQADIQNKKAQALGTGMNFTGMYGGGYSATGMNFTGMYGGSYPATGMNFTGMG